MSIALQKQVIAVGGGIGMGNETVLAMLRQLGHCTVDADEIAQRLTRKGGAGHQLITDQLGIRFLDAEGELDRFRLYEAARSEPRLLDELRSIVYPLVKQELLKLIDAAPGHLVFIKTNDLDAYGLRALCNRIWVVLASEDVQVANLVRERRWSLSSARQFVHAQAPMKPEAPHPDATLFYGSSRALLWDQLVNALCGLDTEAARVADEAALNVTDAMPTLPPVGYQAVEATESLQRRQLRLIGRQIANTVLVLLALAFLTSLGLLLAQYGREHTPITAMQAVWQALINTGQYLVAHPQSYYWAREQVPWLSLVSSTVGHSAALLVLSMGIAVLAGLPLGIAAATARHRVTSAIVMVLSVLGASVPSFLFAMMLWVVNISAHRYLNIKVLPATGFGWDGHLVMPVVVLAMRPLAQVAQVTYVTISEILRQDYVRTASSKGLAWQVIRDRHVLRNALIAILNTLGASLRFSLASLPIVEVFFHWPGIGLMLLDAINSGTAPLVLDLILSMGLFFLLVNVLIEFCFALIDPRLRMESVEAKRSDQQTFQESLKENWNVVLGWFTQLRQFRVVSNLRPRMQAPASALSRTTGDAIRRMRRRRILQSLLRNPVLIASSVILLGLIALALFGSSFTGANPYQVHGVMKVDGEYGAPPFKPSSIFPWGTDHLGRDMRSLVLAGAQKTLSLALFGMLARLLLGILLGILAGWQRGGRLDRMVTAAMGIWAAFPATLFAMILIQALGIQQGMWVFVVAICVVGWGEVAQFVRGQVISLKARPFIESARAVGARADQILIRHIMPNLANPILVLAALEMGGILMLLAELGFLNIFMGGGFRTMIGESGNMQPIIAFYSDIPEWGALIANVRAQWRSYPWMALYPGAAILISIVSFNLFGEGLRRFLDDSAVSLSRLFNRYTFAAAAGVVLVMTLVLRSAAPLGMYRNEGLKFDEQRVMNDIRILSSPMFQGRETGTPGASLAALYIAQRMAEIGIFPAGERYHYLQSMIRPRLHLVSVPTLSVLDGSGQVLKDLTYQRDFVEAARLPYAHGDANAHVMGIAYGPALEGAAGTPSLRDSAATDHVVIVRGDDLPQVKWGQVQGVLVVADEPIQLERRDVYPYDAIQDGARPCMVISAELADSLLRTAGSSLAQLDATRSSLAPGQFDLTREGTTVRMSVQAAEAENAQQEAYINVIGVIPGQGYLMGTQEQVIMVSAYYDGLGTGPTGVMYAGANENASGVAMMLELARLLKRSAYQPDKTVMFVAWAGGERQEGLSVVNIQNARAGGSELNVETVIELSGVGYGTGDSISIGSDSSYRLVQLFQQAAARYRVPTTTRGRGPHYDLPARSIFGGRDGMTLSLSWNGSDNLAHTARDVPAIIDPLHVRDLGRTAYLTLLILSRETEY